MIDLQTNFLVAGDWHGSLSQADAVITSAKIRKHDAIIHVGDFGIWHGDKKYLNKMEALLAEADIHLYFIDGNHENFDMLFVKSWNEDGTRYVRNHISYLPRGFRWNWQGISFMALGGAASIDKKFRHEGKSWWPQELITEEDVQKAIEGGPVDVMFTHDSPSTAPNSITDDPEGQLRAAMYYGWDVLETCTNHRKQLARVTDVVQPVLLFHGHYHKSMQGLYQHDQDNDGRVGMVRGLHEGGGPFMEHVFDYKFEDQLVKQVNDSYNA